MNPPVTQLKHATVTVGMTTEVVSPLVITADVILTAAGCVIMDLYS